MNVGRIVAIAGLALASHCSAALNWITEYETALAEAERQRKGVLINFTGSDWCGWCMKLKGEVFETEAFNDFADANLILLEVDLPRNKPQSVAQRQKNEALMDQFGVKGFPTLVLLSERGKPVGQLGYMAGGPMPMMNAMAATKEITWRPTRAFRPRRPAASGPETPADPWAGMPREVKRFDDLKLTGISGSAARRFAIVNNQTFATGETARVKLRDSHVKLLCKEIRERSVIVVLDGETQPKELFLEAK